MVFFQKGLLAGLSLLALQHPAFSAPDCPDTPSVEVTMPSASQISLPIRVHLPQPVAAPHFFLPTVLSAQPKDLAGGRSWEYSVTLSQAGARGQNANGEDWLLLHLPLTLPEELLEQAESPSVCAKTGFARRIGQQLLLGPGWRTIPAQGEQPAIYHVRPEQAQTYSALVTRLVKQLNTWSLAQPSALPTVVIYEHALPQQVFSGVHEREALSFVVPRAVSESLLYSEGAAVLGHELLHLFTGKGRFLNPYGLQSTDKILREGVLTYGGLVLAHQAGLVSDADFQNRLAHFSHESARVPNTPLRPIQATPGWTRQAYFRGALLAHALTQELAPAYSFQDLFKVLVEAPRPLASEDLAALIQTHFHKDVRKTLETYLYSATTPAD